MNYYFSGYFYGNGSGVDNWFYLLPKISYAKTKLNAWYYFYERFPAFFLSNILYSIFPFGVARILTLLFPYYLSIFGLWWFLKSFMSDKIIAALMVFIFAWSPLIVGTVSHDYPAIYPLSFLILSLALLWRGTQSTNKHFYYFFVGGIFFASAIITNLRIVLYSLFVIPLFFEHLSNSKQEFTTILYRGFLWISGGALMFALCQWIYWITYNDSDFFFRSNIWFIGESESILRENSQFEIALRNVSGIPLFMFIFATILSFLSNRVYWNKFNLGISLCFFTVLTYALLGGNYFISSNYCWPYFLFILTCGSALKKSELTFKNSIYTFAIISAMVSLVFYSTNPPQGYIYDLLNFTFILPIIAIGFALPFLSKKQNGIVAILASLALLSFLLRPHIDYGGHVWSEESTSGDRSNGNAQQYEKIAVLASELKDLRISGQINFIGAMKNADPIIRYGCSATAQCVQFTDSFSEFSKFQMHNSIKAKFYLLSDKSNFDRSHFENMLKKQFDVRYIKTFPLESAPNIFSHLFEIKSLKHQ
tara:strand:- start:158446 stop:160050 length:1605 start_codon:yes stop_codon:yes gene_type:complete